MKHIFAIRKVFFTLVITLFLFHGVGYNQSSEHFSFLAYEKLNLPNLQEKTGEKVRIAVIDDGFNLEHELIAPFLTKLPKDIVGNFLDDDENGFVDDGYGWNVSDNNNEVTISQGLEKKFYHGTMIASIIATVFIETYGDKAPDILEIVPLKAISSNANSTYIKDGYEGIRYALKCNVDIICCAWSGGELTAAQDKLLQQATAQGVVIIGAAGNHFNKVLPPAVHKDVIAVTAIDSNNVLIKTANHGPEIDFVALGSHVRAGHPLANNAFFYGDGTSAACALITGSYGLIKSQFKSKSNSEITDALIYTSSPVNLNNIKHLGRLGSGMPNVKNAIPFLNNDKASVNDFNPLISKGVVFLDPKDKNKQYIIEPKFPTVGFELQIDNDFSKNNKYNVAVKSKNTSIILSNKSAGAGKKQLVLGNKFSVKNLKTKKRVRLTYQPILLDSSKIYCKDTKYLEQATNGLTDGSEDKNYANNCSCKWSIKAPKGKRIRIQVTEMDTQANVDYLWVFNGANTIPQNILGKFSGNKKPPIITSESNEVLLWFLTDDSITAKGWKLNYSWAD